MKAAIQAEWQKVTGYRNLVAFLIWIYPIGTLVSVVLIIILPAVFSETGKQMIIDSQPQWTEAVQAVTLFVKTPENIFVRMPLLAFTAVIFAGEYQWGTWKNSLPRSNRYQLILAKFIVVSGLILIAIVTTSIAWTVGRWVASLVAGVAYGPEVTGTAVFDFLKEYLLNLFLVTASMWIAAALAALIAMYTRSILPSLLLTVGYSIVEPVMSMLLLIVGSLFEKPAIVNLVRLTPSYNLDNVSNWIMDQGSTFGTSNLPGFTTDFSGEMSLLMVGLWLGGLLLVTLWLFSRQDISE